MERGVSIYIALFQPPPAQDALRSTVWRGVSEHVWPQWLYLFVLVISKYFQTVDGPSTLTGIDALNRTH